MNIIQKHSYFRTGVLGAVNGLVFGGVCEIANRIHFELELRELRRYAASGGDIIQIGYVLRWWMMPFFFMLLFVIVSVTMEMFQSKRSVSIGRFWREVGLVAVSVCIVPAVLYGWANGLRFSLEIIGTALFLIGIAFVLNSIFGMFLQRIYSDRAG